MALCRIGVDPFSTNLACVCLLYRCLPKCHNGNGYIGLRTAYAYWPRRVLPCSCVYFRDDAKLKKNPNIQITFGSGWVGGFRAILARKLENHTQH